ncbi:hypothetical protein ACFWP5_08750 [Streptomyces sp. NPDC058469]|uniref:hypothetical protein n=1 Tax=Streptomyces sp. NPDC058469 TaxID=3346514 RepID=UPI00365C802C
MINRTTQTADTEIARRLPAAEREIRNIKNKQSLGGDNMAVLAVDVAEITQVLAAGSQAQYVMTFYGTLEQLYMSELGLGFYVNTNNDANYAWPLGGSLTSDLREITRAHHYDIILSDETGIGLKVYVLSVKNTGTASKTIYTHARLIFPAGILPPT